MIYISLVAFLLSLAVKNGCAKANIKKDSSNNLVKSNNHFLMVELFRVWIESSFRNCTLVKYSFLKRRSWNKWTRIGITNRKRKYRISGCLKFISNFDLPHGKFFGYRCSVNLRCVKNSKKSVQCSVFSVQIFKLWRPFYCQPITEHWTLLFLPFRSSVF